MSTELERIKRAMGLAVETIKEVSSIMLIDRAKERANVRLCEIDSILNPPPEMEEVEVVRWECPNCGGIDKDITYRDHCCGIPAENLVKLTGTLKRPKPQPVERTVSVPCRITGYPDDEFIGKPINLHSGERLYAFAEEDECHGKRGILSFTWTEDPK